MTPVVETCGCLANSCGFKSLIGPGRWLYLLDPPWYSSRGPTSHCMWSPRDPCCPHYNQCFSQDFFLCSLSGNCSEEDGEKVADLPQEDIQNVTIIPRKIQLNLSINKYKAINFLISILYFWLLKYNMMAILLCSDLWCVKHSK